MTSHTYYKDMALVQRGRRRDGRGHPTIILLQIYSLFQSLENGGARMGTGNDTFLHQISYNVESEEDKEEYKVGLKSHTCLNALMS